MRYLLQHVEPQQLVHLQSVHWLGSHAHFSHLPSLQPQASHLQLVPQQHECVSAAAVVPLAQAPSPSVAAATSAIADFAKVRRNITFSLESEANCFADEFENNNHCAV